ncbi:MAG: YceI family protein [Candidatus Acidiferrales bacterium]|jgi:polyisoprenoid-binding protein YceI
MGLIRAALRHGAVFAALICAFAVASPLRAQETVVTLDPAATKIEITLGATLHTVHGAFKLKSGEIHFDSATGKATGSVVVDATSGNTDNGSRDKKMHAEVLESAKFPEVVFTPSQVKGSLKEVLAGQGASQAEVSGVFRLHGQDHDMTLAISAAPAAPGQLQATAKFSIPFVKWGLKDPSTFMLHVSNAVDVEIQTTGRISTPR